MVWLILLGNRLVFLNWAPSLCLALTWETMRHRTLESHVIANKQQQTVSLKRRCLPLIWYIGGDSGDGDQRDGVGIGASTQEHPIQVLCLQDGRLIWRRNRKDNVLRNMLKYIVFSLCVLLDITRKNKVQIWECRVYIHYGFPPTGYF